MYPRLLPVSNSNLSNAPSNPRRMSLRRQRRIRGQERPMRLVTSQQRNMCLPHHHHQHASHQWPLRSSRHPMRSSHCARYVRLVSQLQNIYVVYRPGRDNANVDALSRLRTIRPAVKPDDSATPHVPRCHKVQRMLSNRSPIFTK